MSKGQPATPSLTVLLADVLDEVQGAIEPSLHRLELLLTLWGVASQGEDVLDALLLHLRGWPVLQESWRRSEA